MERARFAWKGCRLHGVDAGWNACTARHNIMSSMSSVDLYAMWLWTVARRHAWLPNAVALPLDATRRSRRATQVAVGGVSHESRGNFVVSREKFQCTCAEDTGLRAMVQSNINGLRSPRLSLSLSCRPTM